MNNEDDLPTKDDNDDNYNTENYNNNDEEYDEIVASDDDNNANIAIASRIYFHFSPDLILYVFNNLMNNYKISSHYYFFIKIPIFRVLSQDAHQAK